MKDAVGYTFSGGNARAIDLLEQALHEFRCFAGNPVATAEAALAEAPDLVMAQVLRAWLYLLSSEAGAVAPAREALAAARELPHNEREAWHLRAIAQLCDGQWRAAALTMEDLSAHYPLDALALQAGQQIDFFVGDSRMLRDRIARALPAWSAGMPGWHAVLGMQAFGLEETGDYLRAERLGRQAVDLQPNDAWAQHAVAHVLEMQGRRDEGIEWMRGNEGWQADSFLAVHNWHLALYHLAQGDSTEVLALYDGPIHGHRPEIHVELVDASALLWRLTLAGADVGTRWSALAERWAPFAGDGHYAFSDWHAAMAFVGAGREDLLQTLLQAQADAMTRNDDNAAFTSEVGFAATRAFIAYGQQDWARTVALLRPVRSQSHRFGGSHAQRDVIELTLIAAAQRSGQAALVRALEQERQALARQRQPERRESVVA
ncbi:tetratricopeptide (TPR) repeat protein [Hydrogenophaga palleronii]|uniref:Tetratricopeptide repeat protein 38 n=1 Tax=Hydrogenophaga palleronii TaxID=65655 RepID=A0ABU1WND0_9BURK|nr:tetratricopeptide repeat protein [Hydrogenophaga palleronii]MDR7150805.1 tetratricopeptide (TPR) repeat protein [Hydrogenophaga palleronii]